MSIGFVLISLSQNPSMDIHRYSLFHIGQFQSLLNDNLEYLILFNKLLQQQMISDSSSPTISDDIELL